MLRKLWCCWNLCNTVVAADGGDGGGGTSRILALVAVEEPKKLQEPDQKITHVYYYRIFRV